MPFDPARDLPVILGHLAGMGRGSNAFTRRWMQLEQMKQQQQMQEQQFANQRDVQQQHLMLQSDAAQRARDAEARRERETYTGRVQELFTDPNIDPDVALNLAQMGIPHGYDPGAIQALHAQVFTPDERTRREAVRALKDIDEDPRIRRLIQANQSIDALTFERPKLGGNPAFLGDTDHPPGSPLYSYAQLQRMAQKTAPSGPLPQITSPSLQPNTSEEAHVADAVAIAEEEKGAPLTRSERAQVRLKAIEEFGRVRRQPDSGPSFSEQRTAQRDRQDNLRAELRDALEFPDQQRPGTMRRLAGEYRKAGLDFERETRSIAAQVARDRATAAQRSLSLEDAGIETTSPEALIERALREGEAAAQPSVAGGRGRGAGPGPAVAAANTRRTATRSDVQKVATRTGTTYEEAKRQLEARGVLVTE